MKNILEALENLIRKLDREAAAELAALKADFETKLGQVLPVLVTLENDVKTAVEQAAPEVRAAIEAVVSKAETELREILKL